MTRLIKIFTSNRIYESIFYFHHLNSWGIAMSFSFVNFHSFTPHHSVECSLCLEICDGKFFSKRVVAHTSTNSNITHCFHSHCLRDWVEIRQGEATCPLCKMTIIIKRNTTFTNRIVDVFNSINYSNLLNERILVMALQTPGRFMVTHTSQNN